MKKVNFKDSPAVVCGLYGFEKNGAFRRLNDEITKAYPRLADADKRPVGARIRFRTDSERVKVVFRVENEYVDRGMSFYQANVGNAFVGKRFAGILTAPDTYGSDTVGCEFGNTRGETVTVFLPRNPTVTDIDIYVDDGAEIFPPADYGIKLPFVFYGSSITENGLTSSANSYPALLSRFFDADFYNFGFSGNAKGEPEMAELIGGIPKSVFFYDYDHNAPTAEHLKATHYDFYRTVRSLDGTVPIIMTSRPANDTDDFAEREGIVRATYEKAVCDGDKNAYFIPGRELFGSTDPEMCTSDRTHPNDLGHYMIAKTLENLILKGNIIK